MNRVRRTKEQMAITGIDVLLITNPSNMNYLTGYNAWSFYVHQMVMILIDEEEPRWIGRKQDANSAKETTWLQNKHILFYTDDFIQSPVKHPMEAIARALKKAGKEKARIGVEMENYYFTAKALKELEKGLPDAKFIDSTLMVNYLRMVKSETEIQYIKKAAVIAAKTMQTAIDSIEVGTRENDAVAEIYHAQISGTSTYGGDYPAIVPLLPSGTRTSSPHITWSDRRYEKDDTVIIEIAGCYERYHAPLARTLVLGTPSDEVRDLSEVVLEGLNETLNAIQPGQTCEEVESVWRDSIARNGFYKDSRIGYSVGLSYPPDWGEHTASLRNGDKTILKPNMTFHIIPGIWFDDYGVEISETFRITKTGCEVLTNFPRKLITK
ncbi:M24 family metallopeptidase [Sediminibacillus massiliensis]|uniref:M24 family metallopeptidase n=1 Tax=Sediminibacillus massiliensis TaxID=1926277 RepID=UPI0009883E98|nr:M24 family metallopeptidase [Sediminibacillus massiliensis]